jgi:hypothetical protein
MNIYKTRRVKFDRRTIISSHVNEIWAVDLIDMTINRVNHGYIFNCVDVFSRRAGSVRIKHKDKTDIRMALNKIISEFGSKPEKIWSDKERAIVGMKDELLKDGIILYHTENSYDGLNSVPIVEVFNREMRKYMMMLKNKLHRINYNQLITRTISEFIEYYNNKIHSTLKDTPLNVYNGIKNNDDVYKKQMERANKPKDEKREIFNVNEMVYLSKPKKQIESKYTPKWHAHKFKIIEVKPTNPTTYKLENKTPAFYGYQLNK